MVIQYGLAVEGPSCPKLKMLIWENPCYHFIWKFVIYQHSI
jgi:hypothetical protein